MKRVTHALRRAAAKKTDVRATHCGISCMPHSRKLYSITNTTNVRMNGGLLRATSLRGNAVTGVTCWRCLRVLGKLGVVPRQQADTPVRSTAALGTGRWSGAVGSQRLDALAEFDQTAYG